MLVRRYIAEILPIRRKTPYNQSINHTMLALDPSLSTILDIQFYQLLAQGSLIKPKIDFTMKHSTVYSEDSQNPFHDERNPYLCPRRCS